MTFNSFYKANKIENQQILLKIILALSFFPAISWANPTICKIEESSTGIKAIAWDNDTGMAKIIDEQNNSHEGIVTLIRKHSDNGNKTNIYIKYDKPYFGRDAVEFIVFPVGSNKFRIIGVSYILKDGKQFLDTSEGNFSAICLGM